LLLAARIGFHARGRQPETVRRDEIVAASPARVLAAHAETGLPPRFSRPEVPAPVVKDRM
jgi:hypothetical protein